MFDPATGKAIEVKHYLSGKVALSETIEKEARVDIALLNDPDNDYNSIKWVFTGNGPTPRLRALLEENGIILIENSNPKQIILLIMITDLTEKEEIQRQAWVDEWLEHKDAYLADWIASQPEKYRERLDYTPESLKVAGELLINYFYEQFDPNDNIRRQLRSFDHKTTYDGIAAYGLEVFWRNAPEVEKWYEWTFNQQKIPSDSYQFMPVIRTNYFTHEVDYQKHFQYMIFNKLPDKLYEVYPAQIDSFAKYSQDYLLGRNQPSKPVPGRGGNQYEHLLLLVPDSTGKVLSLEQIKNTLQTSLKGTKFEPLAYEFHHEKHLLVHQDKDYYFHFELDDRDFIIEESKELADSYKGDKDKSLIARASQRIEFWGDQDDRVVYFNEYSELLSAIQKNHDVLIYVTYLDQGLFFDEE